MGTPANPLPRKPRKKLGTPKTDLFVTPGWVEDEVPYTTPEPEPGQQHPNPATDQKRKYRKLQRA